MSSNPVQPLSQGQTQQALQSGAHHGYFVRNAVALDELFDQAVGDQDFETLSAHFARMSTEAPRGSFERRFGAIMCNFLDVFSRDHGAKAELGDLARARQTAAALEAAPTVQQEGQ